MFSDNDNHAISDGHSKARVNELSWEFYDSVYNDLLFTLVNSSDSQIFDKETNVNVTSSK